jgi:hypothetical protein
MRPCVLGFAVIVSLTIVSPALTHDHWINHGAFRNAAGEWCCGEGDCFSLASDTVSLNGQGYILHGLNEFVPFAEAQPSPDGAYWRCKRPDGTRRCFFAPPPNS